MAGREIYEQRQPENREDHDRDGRLAIGMDRIREEFGWLEQDGEDAGAADGGRLAAAAERDINVARSRSQEAQEEEEDA